MKFQLTSVLAVTLVMLLLFTACSAVPNGPEDTSGTEATVEDLFNRPAVDTTPSDPVPEVTSPAATAAPVLPPKGPVSGGGLGAGMKYDFLMDENGNYCLYEGGEMNMPFFLQARGFVSDVGVGILLFVDGLPQPYKTAENDTYQYLHTFYPPSGKEYIVNTFFVPVTGQAGDDLEISFATILDPDYSLSEGARGFVYTFGSVVGGARLICTVTPPASQAELPNTRIASLTTTYVDTKSAEIGGCSDKDLMEKVEMRFYVNDVPQSGNTTIKGVTAEEPVKLRYEVWGSPYVHYGLVFFVDNEPVFAPDRWMIPVQVENGRKTVIEAELDMTGFDGESVVYAVLVPRNSRISEIETMAFITPSTTFFLVSD